MKLTSEQAKKAIDELKKFSPLICSVCKNSSLQLNDTIFELREFNQGNFVVGGQSNIFPVLTLTCNKCGHTYFFNAILLGVLPKDNTN